MVEKNILDHTVSFLFMYEKLKFIMIMNSKFLL